MGDRTRRARPIAALVLGWLLAASGAAALAAEPSRKDPAPPRITRCADGVVVVQSHDRADAAIACDGGRDAIVFLESQGFAAPAKLAIEIARKLPEIANPSAVGCYLDQYKCVVVLCYAEFRRFGTWFELPIDRKLYRSLISHETAHAVAAWNFKMRQPQIQAHEYIAYVTMFATMDPTLRSRALSKFPGDGFGREIEINSTVYMPNPMYFGAQAYRHYLKPGNGRAFLHAVIEGKVLTEE
jgi:hypothetical protein